jgi:hypothetical protein
VSSAGVIPGPRPFVVLVGGEGDEVRPDVLVGGLVRLVQDALVTALER